MHVVRQAWWAPLALLLIVAELLVAQAFIWGEGTSNALDAESTADGVALSLAGAAALGAGLWIRPRARRAGSVLVVIGAALAGIWVWTVVMAPLALAVIVGVAVTELGARSEVEAGTGS